MPFISSAMECSPTDCPNCHFIIDYKYREGWCDYDGDGDEEYIREIFLGNYQAQNCPETCWDNRLKADSSKGKYQFALYCLLKNHQWNTDMLEDETTLLGGTKFNVWVRNFPCGKAVKWVGNSKNATLCYNNYCCNWLYKLRYIEPEQIPYILVDLDNGWGEIYAVKLNNINCETFDCPDTDLCRLCFCDFSLNGVNPAFEPKTSINEYHIKNKDKIIIFTKDNLIDIILLNYDVSNLQVVIYDIMGQELLYKNIEQTTNNEKYQLDLGDITNGVYFLKITQNNNKLYSGKILVYR